MAPPAKGHVVVIGSGAGASVAASTLVSAGWDVTLLEKGRNEWRGLDDPLHLGPPMFGNDEIRPQRGYLGLDDLADPRTGRTQEEAAGSVEHSFVGSINQLPSTVGGGTTHWDAAVPRFWDIDFRMHSEFGPVAGADVVDWPFGYTDLAPYYDRVESVLGVQGSLAETPQYVLDHLPGRGEYQMPPGPHQYNALIFRAGANKLGYHPMPFPKATNSTTFNDRPACNNCGFCSHYGCPIHARGGAAVSWLRPALLAGAQLQTRCMVTKIRTNTAGTQAVGVEYLQGLDPVPKFLAADVVVLAASAIETARVALLSGIGNSSGRVGHTLCFHADTFAAGQVPQRLHAYRGRSSDMVMMEACVPDKALGKQYALPYVRGGVVEIGGAPMLLEEAGIYSGFPFSRGKSHKNLMRQSPLRDHLCAVQMIGEDMSQYGNTVDLDPTVRDLHGLPVARITYSRHKQDVVASWTWGPRLLDCMYAAGATTGYFLPNTLSALAGGSPITSDTRHISGTMRMGTDAATSVTDEFGRMHDVPNVVVCDAAVFSSAGAFNPTNTIMSVSLRSSTALAYGEAQARSGPVAV